MKTLVYLAGPITGAAPGSDWRSICARGLGPNICVLDPTRQKIETIDESGDLSDAQRLQLALHGRSIAARDRFDVGRCDLIIVNFLGAARVSIGTVGEIFWADAFRKPVILIRDPGNIHTHALLDALVGWIVPSVDEAIRVAKEILAAESVNGTSGA